MTNETEGEVPRDGRCMDCLVDVTFETPDEYYMVHDALWLRANPEGIAKLCVGCLENRIGRRLNATDFIDTPVNKQLDGKSERLRSRIVGT